MPSEITFAELYRQSVVARREGKPINEAHVGPETWKFLLKASGFEEGEDKHVTAISFAGANVEPANVPEGKLWPK